MTSTEQNTSSNKILIIVVAVIAFAAGGVGVYAISEQNIVTSQDVKELISDVNTDVENIDPGYGQVTKQDGSYFP
jgi:hypothetical protein